MRSNAITINISRTRTSEFTPLTLGLIKKNREDIDDLCLLLTKKGMSSRDISFVLNNFFRVNSFLVIGQLIRQPVAKIHLFKKI